MAELRSSDVLSKQDAKNKTIDNRLVKLEEIDANNRLTILETTAKKIDSRLENLEFTKKINLTELTSFQGSSTWHHQSISTDEDKIVSDFILKYNASSSTSNYIFRFYLRQENIQLTCTKIEYSGQEYYLYFGDTIVRIRGMNNDFLVNFNKPCQLILHYSLL